MIVLLSLAGEKVPHIEDRTRLFSDSGHPAMQERVWSLCFRSTNIQACHTELLFG